MPAITLLPQLLGVSTTTVVSSPTTSPSPSTSGDAQLPIGAIAGGTAGGAVLALGIVIAWRIWGRSIKRTKVRQQKEADDLRITKHNTLKNASTFSKPRNYSYKPLFRPPRETDTKVKFAAPDGSVKSTPASNSARKTPSHPRPLAPHSSRSSKDTASTGPESIPVPPSRKPRHPPPAQLAHEPSTLGSESVYSTESAEDAQRPASSSIFALLTALGNLSSEAVHSMVRSSQASGQRLSTASNWSWFSRSTGNRSGGGFMNRNSQATTASSYSQPSNQSALSVGVAY